MKPFLSEKSFILACVEFLSSVLNCINIGSLPMSNIDLNLISYLTTYSLRYTISERKNNSSPNIYISYLEYIEGEEWHHLQKWKT